MSSEIDHTKLEKALETLADLARPDQLLRSRFKEDVRELVLEFVKHPNMGRGFKIPDTKVVAEYERIKRSAEKLREQLDKLKPVRLDQTVHRLAGLRLNAVLPEQMQIKEYHAILGLLSSHIDVAVRFSTMGRTKGTAGNRGLDSFVERLLQYAEQRFGSLKIYKSESKAAKNGWSGSLLEAIDTLGPLFSGGGPLPTKLPGHVLHRIYKGYRRSAVGKYLEARNRPSPKK
jgi:hypothetical protein